jgi:drug/metabolite transporter (DMT)-like permease
MLDLLLSDPVAWGSVLGIGVVCAICGYYVYYFIHNVNENN